MISRLPHIAARLFNTPLVLHPRKAEVIVAALADRLGIARIDRLNFQTDAWDDGYDKPGETIRKSEGYEVIDGAAVISVYGTLVNKLGSLEPVSGMTGYDGIRHNFLHALENPDVKGIVFDVDSPGGDAAGCFDLVDVIYEARGKKPTIAILSECAFSGAFAIASAADQIALPRTGGTGSVGVIVARVDMSRMLDEEGLRVHFVTYGNRKAEGHPELPMTDGEETAIQEAVDYIGELFVSTVARNLRIPKQRVINTQAGTFMAEESVKLGFAHAILPPDEAFRQFTSQL